MNSKLPPSLNSVEFKSFLTSYSPLNIKLSTLNIISALTLFNNKNRCNTSPVTVTLWRLTPLLQPTIPPKSVTPLLHFPPEISQLSSGIANYLTFY